MEKTGLIARVSFPARKTTVVLLLVLGSLVLSLSYYSVLQAKPKRHSSQVLVLGHAGSGFFSPFNPYNPLPSNSKASIVKAMEKNRADGVELDVHVSRDGVPILYHDTRLETMSEGQGVIEQLLAEEVVGLKYKGGILYDLFHSERIIALEEVLQLFKEYPELPFLHIDVRHHDASRNTFYAESLLQLLRKYEYPLEKLAFIFADAGLLQVIREFEPAAILMLDAGDDFEATVQEALAHSLQGVTANGKRVNKKQVQQAKEQGLQVVLFGGKSRGTIAKMLEMEPDAIQVNNVKRMRALLETE